MRAQITCLVNGAVVAGKRRRAGERFEVEMTDELAKRLAVVEAAGDIIVQREAPPVAKPVAAKKAIEP